MFEENQYIYCQKSKDLNRKTISNTLHLSKYSSNIFTYTETVNDLQMDTSVEYVDIFAVFGFAGKEQVVQDSQINISIQFQIIKGALVCFQCGLYVSESIMIFTANSSTLSALIIECTSSLSIQNSVIQYRFNSNASSGVVSQLDSQPATFSILNSKITGCNLKTSAFNGYISSSVAAPVTLTVSNLSVCVDTLNIGTSSATLTVSGAVLAQCQNICSGTDVYTYGLCLPALQFGSLVSFKSTCVLPFEFVLDQCLCAHGYFLNLTYCVPVVKQLTNLDVQLSQNVSEIYANISRNVNIFNADLAANASSFDSSLQTNTVALDKDIAAKDLASNQDLQRNTTYIENMINANTSFFIANLVSNVSKVYADMFSNSQKLETNVISNFSKLEGQLIANNSILTTRLNRNFSDYDASLQTNTGYVQTMLAKNTSAQTQALQTNMAKVYSDLRSANQTIEARIIGNSSIQDSNLVSNSNILENAIISKFSTLDQNFRATQTKLQNDLNWVKNAQASDRSRNMSLLNQRINDNYNNQNRQLDGDQNGFVSQMNQYDSYIDQQMNYYTNTYVPQTYLRISDYRAPVIIQPGSVLCYTGTLQAASDGSDGTGRSFTNYRIHIVRIRSGYAYPILMGDNWSEMLGWTSADRIRNGGVSC
ncbi:Conserved_hypothetical protein [Hexamita inflata]|uniref:Uncharacterized protein n=1 Tax=Hexamita inflata TaxID=28002 RepID=A0ABP1GJA2_9EUKA